MLSIKITASDGQELFGTLPTGWADTPLAPYAALSTATTLPETCEAVARLLGLPAGPFLEDVSLLVPIKRAAPWLFDDSLPPDLDYLPATLHHAGRRYQHVGSLDKINAEQMEALLAFLHAHAEAPLLAAPHLLAVLYCPPGVVQTADVVAATATAFATLDMAQAWPALSAFLRSSARAALRIRTASALVGETNKLLTTLEAAVAPTTTGSRTCSSSMRRWLTRQWLRHARKMLS